MTDIWWAEIFSSRLRRTMIDKKVTWLSSSLIKFSLLSCFLSFINQRKKRPFLAQHLPLLLVSFRALHHQENGAIVWRRREDKQKRIDDRAENECERERDDDEEKRKTELLRNKNERKETEIAEEKRKSFESFMFPSFSSWTVLKTVTMNGSWPIHSVSKSNYHIQLTDRLLAIYSLLLILIGTPCNILCCLIYFQKSNRANSIKTIFGYLAVLDTIVLYTFNLNYVFREFNVHVRITYHPHSPIKTDDGSYFNPGSMNIIINKKNLEEHSILICRCLSYLGKSWEFSDISSNLANLILF